jgi:tetratricopeptide (TPR) repeat protein
MWRLFPYLRWFWGAVVVTIILGAANNLLFAPIRDEVSVFLRVHRPLISLSLLMMGVLTLWSWIDKRGKQREEETQRQYKEKERERHEQAERERQLSQNFALFKPAQELRPEDLGFRMLRRGAVPDPRYRPHYEVYIPRKAAPYDGISLADYQQTYDENKLAQSLEQGRGFVLVGQPLSGKSRTLYETVRRLVGYHVIRPADGPTPSDEAFAILKGHRVILFLEDLNSHAPGVPDLKEFSGKLSQYAETWAVAAACRDGPELGVVKEAIGTNLRRFYEDIPFKLGFLPLTTEEKGRLAQGIGKDWNPQESEVFPTPGSITMKEPLAVIRERFQALGPEQKDVLRGLKLLTAAGILPFTHRRLQAVLQHIFNRIPHLGDSLDILAEQSLLRRPARQDPIQPEPAYLQGAVTYIEGKVPGEDFCILICMLAEISDADGLYCLANTYALILGEREKALEIDDRALQIDPENFGAWASKGATLAILKRYQEALERYDHVLEFNPENFGVLMNKSTALAGLGRHQEALEVLDHVLELNAKNANVWVNKGVTLEELGRPQEALEVYDRALHLNANFPDAWANKGLALAVLERYQEALEAFDHALQLDPENSNVWANKGAALATLERHREALEALDRALELDPENAHGYHNKGTLLYKLGLHRKAQEAYDRALQVSRNKQNHHPIQIWTET